MKLDIQNNNNNNNKIKESTYCSSVLHTVLHTHTFFGRMYFA